MQVLLNISTHPSDLAIIDHDWSLARAILTSHGFDGYELYPVLGYPFDEIPADLIHGLHLPFFPIIEPCWHERHERLMEIFGNRETVCQVFGGYGRPAILNSYRRQFDLAHRLGCAYTVCHAAQCEFEYLYDWQFPWSWRETVDLSADIMNEATHEMPFGGWLLFENLWWPGSLRLDEPAEIERLLERVTYPCVGIMLDTGHVMNKNPHLRDEDEGIEYLLSTVRNLGTLRAAIKGVHLTCSLSGAYVQYSQAQPNPLDSLSDYWTKFYQALEHVQRIDQHAAFTSPGIARLFDLIDPEYVVFEFSYRSREEWCKKIQQQWAACAGMGRSVMNRQDNMGG